MAEWLILLLLVPAVVVPVVLLVGFAGCDQLFGLVHVNTPPPVPIIQSAEGKSVHVITLTWKYEGTATAYEFERLEVKSQTKKKFMAATSPHHDDNEGNGLAPETDYRYRARAIGSDGEPGPWSSNEPNIAGKTLPFVETFAWSDQERVSATPNPLQGTCIIQRIEAARLSTGGAWVRLTLSGSPMGSASIDAISISKPADPALGKDPYDPDTDPTPVTSKVFVTANSVTLPEIRYDLDPEQALLIAIEFSTIAPSTIKKLNALSGASAFYKVATGPGPTGEAANPDRTGFSPAGAVMYLIEKIEVG